MNYRATQLYGEYDDLRRKHSRKESKNLMRYSSMSGLLSRLESKPLAKVVADQIVGNELHNTSPCE